MNKRITPAEMEEIRQRTEQRYGDLMGEARNVGDGLTAADAEHVIEIGTILAHVSVDALAGALAAVLYRQHGRELAIKLARRMRAAHSG